MSSERVEVEGASLEEALERAAELLSVPRRAVAFQYDREHLAQGASTVKIIASVLSAEAQAKAAEEEAKRAASAPPPRRFDDRPRDDRGGRGGRDDRRGGGGRGGRDDRGRGGGGGRDRPAGAGAGAGAGGRGAGPRDDRGGGAGSRGGGPRDDRGGGFRGDRGGGGRPEVKRDPERDEQLRQKARGLAERVLAGEPAQSIDDLNSYERHLVHEVVAQLGNGLHSESAPGEERRKTITISKKSE